jgi:hypothetical protein
VAGDGLAGAAEDDVRIAVLADGHSFYRSQLRKDSAMKPAIRRTMRVATTFTGAAACAVAFNPAAMAATARLAQPGIAENHTVSGNIHSGTCAGPNASHWLHIGGPYGSRTCIGFAGVLDLSPYPNMRSFCGGNNSGGIWGSGPKGPGIYSFHPGTYFWHLPRSSAYFYVSIIELLFWKGGDKCP